jgi:hypothetical protein
MVDVELRASFLALLVRQNDRPYAAVSPPTTADLSVILS